MPLELKSSHNPQFEFFFLDSRKPHLPENTLCGPRWASKTPAVSGSYKKCTPWLELKTCYADLKFFAIKLRHSIWN